MSIRNYGGAVVELTPENIQSFNLRKAVGDQRLQCYEIPDFLPTGTIVAVFRQSPHDDVNYLGRIKRAVVPRESWDKGTIGDWCLFYDIEQPDGKIDQAVDKTYVKVDLEGQVAWRKRRLEEAKEAYEREQKALEWLQAGEVGFLKREYRYGPPKKSKAKPKA